MLVKKADGEDIVIESDFILLATGSKPRSLPSIDIDNEKYIIKVIRKRNEADGDGVEDTEGVHENEGEVSLDSNVTDKN